MISQELQEIINIADMHAPVGSRVTCNPAPTNTDEDYLLLIQSKEKLVKIYEKLSKEGWVLGGSMICCENNYVQPHDKFQSFTKGCFNLIITESDVFYRKFMAATSVAKLLNVLDKNHRISLFQAVLYANY